MDAVCAAEDPAELDEELVLRPRRHPERRAELLEVLGGDVAQPALVERRG
jgi:hypothetical protein